MLYNKEWDGGGEDIRSLDSLIAWLETKPADRRYDYCDVNYCVLAQYFSEKLNTPVLVGAENYSYWDGPREIRLQLPPHFNKIAQAGLSIWGPETFGKALKVARRIRARNNGGPVRRVLGRLAAFFGL